MHEPAPSRRRARVRAAASVVLVAVAGAVFTLAPEHAVAKGKAVPVCELVTTAELTSVFATDFASGEAAIIGTGRTCGYTGTGTGPVRYVTVRIATGTQARVGFRRTMKALRETLRGIDSPPPAPIADLGDRAYFSFDEFLGEASLEVLDGRRYVQVTASLTTNDGDRSVVAESVLRALAVDVLDRA